MPSVESAVCERLCTNPIILSAVKAWRSIRTIEGRAQFSSPLTPILESPDFLLGCHDQGFRVWHNQGITKIGDLFDGQTLLSFLQLQQQYSLQKCVFFFLRYLQIRHFITKTTKQAWERDLDITIDDLDWQEVWVYAGKISICNRTKSTQFRILHRTHITPALKNKMDTNASPLCSKCNSETGNLIHCFWSCVKLQCYWSGIVKELLFLVFQ
ncbi:hypothetical protein F7725_009441 [Dissostichus mawsoni]|uniref:Reverse transcriptase zinc-binding domain-containing protein n=1 Tax=Dissostichus mawsoni TaxID=36200 RepID=A0A7J5XLE8_DISMA|nr:hypothetical protein F7725_009441 [Dissostichus mawsoni]